MKRQQNRNKTTWCFTSQVGCIFLAILLGSGCGQPAEKKSFTTPTPSNEVVREKDNGQKSQETEEAELSQEYMDMMLARAVAKTEQEKEEKERHKEEKERHREEKERYREEAARYREEEARYREENEELEARLAGRSEVARNLLARKFSIESVGAMVGLSQEKIKEIQQAMDEPEEKVEIVQNEKLEERKERIAAERRRIAMEFLAESRSIEFTSEVTEITEDALKKILRSVGMGIEASRIAKNLLTSNFSVEFVSMNTSLPQKRVEEMKQEIATSVEEMEAKTVQQEVDTVPSEPFARQSKEIQQFAKKASLEGRRCVAWNLLLSNLSIEFIAEATGFSQEEVKAIQQEIATSVEEMEAETVQQKVDTVPSEPSVEQMEEIRQNEGGVSLEATRDIVRNLLTSNLSIEFIAGATGLSREEVGAIQRDMAVPVEEVETVQEAGTVQQEVDAVPSGPSVEPEDVNEVASIASGSDAVTVAW